jgi:hypothetical protein
MDNLYQLHKHSWFSVTGGIHGRVVCRVKSKSGREFFIVVMNDFLAGSV